MKGCRALAIVVIALAILTTLASCKGGGGVSDNVLPLDQNIQATDTAMKKAERDCLEAKSRGQNKSNCPKKP